MSSSRIKFALNSANAAIHSITSNAQHLVALNLPALTVAGIAADAAWHALRSLPVATGVDVISTHLLPVASVLDGVFRIGMGLSKIAFSEEYEGRLMEPIALRNRGLFEACSGIATTTLGICAVASTSVPIAMVAFAVANYCDFVMMYHRNDPNVTTSDLIFKMMEASGWLLSAFAVTTSPLIGLVGVVLLGVSAIAKIQKHEDSCLNNMSVDTGRLHRWWNQTSIYPSESQRLIDSENNVNMDRVIHRAPL